MNRTLGRVFLFSVAGVVLSALAGAWAVHAVCEATALQPNFWFVGSQCGDTGDPTPANLFSSFFGGLTYVVVGGFFAPLALMWDRLSFGTLAVSATVLLLLFLFPMILSVVFSVEPTHFQTILRVVGRGTELLPFILIPWLSAVTISYLKNSLSPGNP